MLRKTDEVVCNYIYKFYLNLTNRILSVILIGHVMFNSINILKVTKQEFKPHDNIIIL